VARTIADGVVKEFLRHRFEQKSATTALAGEFLVGEADRLKEQLQKSEEALHRYKVDHNAAALQENQNTVVQSLQALNEKVTQARSDRMRLEGDVARAKEMAGRPNELLMLPSVANHPAVVGVSSSIADKESEISVLSQRYKPKHPKYIAAQAQLASLREQRAQVIASAADLLSGSFRNAQETEGEFARALADQEARALQLSEKGIQYNVLTRDVDSNRTMYETVLARLKETDVTKDLDQTQVRVVENAFSFGPVRPDKKKILIGAIVGGIVVGIALAVGLSLLDTSLKTVDETEEALGLPVLTAVPKTKVKERADAAGGGFPVLNDAKGQTAESFRSLRSSLALLGRQEARRTFLFTSAIPSEGKSFSCSNYALVSAQLRVSTLLIDADLRRPSISKLFFGENRKPGLSDCLAGQATLENSVCSTDLEHLKVLPAGTIAPNPAELLSSDDFAALLKEALLRYDRVIIDTAPVNAVSDTLMLAPHVQTICMVVGAASTPKAAVQRACKALVDINCKPAGLILNRVPQRHGAGYYYHYSAGEYGTEGVYGAKAS
jgi:capsular exopolysaccharide synthesis family protein